MTGQGPGDFLPDEMSEYLQVFVDETSEQLDDLTQALLVLESEPANAEQLNEAFRLVHSIKGSAGMMGLDSIAALTHHLESRFERFRSGVEQLDQTTMNLVLRIIDFLRDCVARLRTGERLGSAAELLAELAERPDHDQAAQDSTPPAVVREPSGDPQAGSPEGDVPPNARRVVVRFEADLPLVDLKARLILTRLADLGDIIDQHPAEIDEGTEALERLEVVLSSNAPSEEIGLAADVHGVRSVDVEGGGEASNAAAGEDEAAPASETAAEPDEHNEPVEQSAPVETEGPGEPEATPPEPTVAEERAPSRRHGETMRVDIERLDQLMNLAGELVVNRARFQQMAGMIAPVFGRRHAGMRVRDLSEGLRRTVEHLRGSNGERSADVDELILGLELLETQADVLDQGRRVFAQIGEAIDQLGRISENIQQNVLQTRMVPVAPLFTRFNRVVRDLASERGKQVELVIRGEKTELDKRMIDELGDPLVHLVRNSIDHGLESPEVRSTRGKPAAGTITLEASHSGNNVFITVTDDGGGIDAAGIRAKAVERGLMTEAQAANLSDAQALECIWQPGFSTASEVTDISGRGVGMDAVRTRIAELNGHIEVESTPERGTTFSIRLPLTLAIINSLLIRARGTIFSVPISDVREIVSVKTADVITVHARQTIDVRGEFISVVGIDDVFEWSDHLHAEAREGEIHVVLLQSGDSMLGLRVDELMGSEDIVIKSLSENFVHIQGLSGASILGDGSVCLMLDTARFVDLAVHGRKEESVA